MLNFPAWKVVLITFVLVCGIILALPNVLSDSFLGIETRPVSNLAGQAETISEVQEQSPASRQATNTGWFLPRNKLKLGLDLQGGVYLLVEIDPAEVAANRLEVVQSDIRAALTRKPVVRRKPPVQNRDRLTIELIEPEQDMAEAERRLRRLNPVIGTTQTRLFKIERVRDRFIQLTIPDDARALLSRDAQGKIMEIIRRRIDPDGVLEVAIIPQGNNRIILEAPGEADPKRIKDVLSQAGRLTFNMANTEPTSVQAAERTGRAPPGWMLVDDVAYGTILVRAIPELTGADIASANRGADEANRPAVNFRLNDSAASKFYNLTRNNRGRQFAIVLDGTSMSTPVIREPIPGGNVQISGGNFTVDEAEDLAAIIEAGELPAKLNFLDERTVGPTLGLESIRAGSRASLIGLGFVALFMIMAYGLIGGFAVTSLLFNIILIIGALSGFGATLTLPGIAGIILTIGMAVDANVVVFERIREEQASGRSPATAIQTGYERALSAILDANITTFIAALILWGVGSGPVRGFAVTLSIGILTSVFTAFVLTRWFTVLYVRTMRPKRLAM